MQISIHPHTLTDLSLVYDVQLAEFDEYDSNTISFQAYSEKDANLLMEKIKAAVAQHTIVELADA